MAATNLLTGKINWDSYKPVNNPAGFNLNSVSDVSTLNKALKGGQISTQQWNQRFQQLQKAPPHIETGIVRGFNPFNNQSVARQQTINPVLDSIKAVPGDIKGAVITRAKAFTAPTSTQAERDAIINNQKTAAKKATPAELAALKQAQDIGLGRGAKTTIAVQKQIAQGANPKQVIATANKGTAAGKANEAKALNTLLNVGGINVAGGGLLSKTAAKTGLSEALSMAKGRVAAGAGRDTATTALIDTQRAQTALKQAKISSLTGKAVVDEAKTQRIPVVSPNETVGARRSVGNVALTNSGRSTIPVTGTTSETGVGVRLPIKAGVKEISTINKIGVRTPVQMADKDFNKELQTLNRNHARDTRQLKKVLTIFPTKKAKELAKTVDAEYQSKLDDLMSRYKTPELSAPTKPKLIDKSTTPAGKNTGGLQKPVKVAKQPRTLANTLTNIQQTSRGSVPVPRSALDKHIVEPPSEAPTSPVTTPTTQTKQIPATTPKPAQTAPKSASRTTPTVRPAVKTSGSSLRTQSKAVEAGMKSEAETTGATYNTVSHKEEAAKATQLVEENPEKAKSIAMGARGDNASHEAAVYHAVANKAIEQAKKTGDYSEVTALANSPRHTAVSEAAQKLGAEGYNANPHDPINIMNDLAKTREAAVTKRAGKPSVAKATTEIKKEVKAAAPKVSRQDWHSFIQELQCK